MERKSIAVSAVWWLFVITPLLFAATSSHLELGFYSVIYACVFFVLETFKNITPIRAATIIVLGIMVVLMFASAICLIRSRGKKIHPITILATSGELLIQFFLALTDESKSLAAFLSPTCIFLLLIWMVCIWNNQGKERGSHP